MNKQIVLTLFCLTLFVAADAQTVHLSRLQRAAGLGYVPYTDGTGKAAYTLLSSLITPSDFGSGTDNRIAYWLNDTLSSTIWEMNSTYIRGSGTGWPQMDQSSFTFRGDTDTGIERIGSDIVGILAGSANPRIRATSGVVDFDTDASGTSEWGLQPGLFYSITSGAPRIFTTKSASAQYSFTDDTDTGVSRKGADTLAIHAGDFTNPIAYFAGVGNKVAFDANTDGTIEVEISATTMTTELLDIGTYGTTSTKLAGLNASGVVTEVTLSGLSFSGDVLTATDGSTTNEIQDLTIGGSGPTYTVDISSGSDVTIAAAGIATLSEGTPNILTITATEVDGSTTNEIQSISVTGTTTATIDLSDDATDASITGAGIAAVSVAGNAITITATEIDGSVSNELQDLTIGGSGPTYTVDIASGADVTIAAAGIATLSEGTPNILTITATEVDGSTTNEIQSISVTGTTTATIDLSDDATDASITGAGISTVSVAGNAITVTSTEIDGSVSNELQDLTIGGSGPTYTVDIASGADVTIAAAGINTLSEGTANVLTITGTEVDGSTTNEIQQITPSDNGTNFWWALGSSTDSIVLVEGTGITMSRSGDNVTINAAGGGVTGSGVATAIATWATASTLTNTDWIILSNTMSGPTLGDPAMSITDDAYSFTGDSNTGLKWSAADIAGLHAGDATNPMIKWDGTVDAITFDPDDDGTADVSISTTTTTVESLTASGLSTFSGGTRITSHSTFNNKSLLGIDSLNNVSKVIIGSEFTQGDGGVYDTLKLSDASKSRLFYGDDQIGSAQVISVGGGSPYDTIVWTTTFQQEQGITYGAPNASTDSAIIFTYPGVYEISYSFTGELAAAATNVSVFAKWNKNGTTAVSGSTALWGFEETNRQHYSGVFQFTAAANDYIQLLMKNSTASASNLSFDTPKVSVKYVAPQ